jgi:hypothetical protein
VYRLIVEEEEERRRRETETRAQNRMSKTIKELDLHLHKNNPPQKKKAYLGGNHQSRSINNLPENLNFEVRFIDKWIILGRG